MSLDALKAEIDGDPLTRGYAGMTDQQVADDLNTVYRTLNKASVTGDEIFNAIVPAQYAALTDAQKQIVMGFCGRDSVDPFAANNVAFFTDLFSGQTITNLNTLRVEAVSRAAELNLGRVFAGTVGQARAL